MYMCRCTMFMPFRKICECVVVDVVGGVDVVGVCLLLQSPLHPTSAQGAGNFLKHRILNYLSQQYTGYTFCQGNRTIPETPDT